VVMEMAWRSVAPSSREAMNPSSGVSGSSRRSIPGLRDGFHSAMSAGRFYTARGAFERPLRQGRSMPTFPR
jgi:hypothetical protein